MAAASSNAKMKREVVGCTKTVSGNLVKQLDEAPRGEVRVKRRAACHFATVRTVAVEKNGVSGPLFAESFEKRASEAVAR